MTKVVLLLACLGCFLGITLGAFASHGLKGQLTASALATWQVGVQYQMYHSLALLGVGILMLQVSDSLLIAAALSFTVGILCFSGSLYLLALTRLAWLGPMTPVGGLFFLLGWGLLALALLRRL